MSHVHHATDATFDQLLATGKPTLVDFWATWCGPCRQVGPVVEAIAEEHPEYTVIKVDIDQAQSVATRYGISGVPTLMVFTASGELASSTTGAKPKAALLSSLADVA